MRVRILRPSYGHADGIELRLLEVGFSYDVSPVLGARLVSTRCAELVPSQDPMLLVPVLMPTESNARADDSGRRESLLSFEPVQD